MVVGSAGRRHMSAIWSVAITAVAAVDSREICALIADMASRITRCRRCAYFAWPGMSNGYCTGRNDLREGCLPMLDQPAPRPRLTSRIPIPQAK